MNKANTGLDNGLSPNRRQAIILTNVGLRSTGPIWTYFSEIWINELTFSLKKMPLKMSSADRRPSCLGLNELNQYSNYITWKCVSKCRMWYVDYSGGGVDGATWINSLTFKCEFSWAWSRAGELKPRRHTPHRYFAPSPCTSRMWAFTLDTLLKDLPHVSHWLLGLVLEGVLVSTGGFSPSSSTEPSMVTMEMDVPKI